MSTTNFACQIPENRGSKFNSLNVETCPGDLVEKINCKPNPVTVSSIQIRILLKHFFIIYFGPKTIDWLTMLSFYVTNTGWESKKVKNLKLYKSLTGEVW